MDVAQSPPSCDWLGEPLGLGESQGLTSSCPRWAWWIPPTLPHNPRSHQAEASAWLMPPISSANSQSVLSPLLVLSPVAEPITPEERKSLGILVPTSAEDVLRQLFPTMPTLTQSSNTCGLVPLLLLFRTIKASGLNSRGTNLCSDPPYLLVPQDQLFIFTLQISSLIGFWAISGDIQDFLLVLC